MLVWLCNISNLGVATAGYGSLSFPRRVRIIKTDDFSSVFNFRKRISGRFLVIQYRYNCLGWPRLGLIVAKKTTPLSVDRNYAKRVLRELFRRQQGHLKNLDLIVRVQKTFYSVDFPAIENEFIELLARLHSQLGQAAINHQTDSEPR